MFLILRALPKWSRGGRTRTGHGSVELGEAFVLPRYQSLPKGLRIKLSDADILEREFSLALLSASESISFCRLFACMEKFYKQPMASFSTAAQIFFFRF